MIPAALLTKTLPDACNSCSRCLCMNFTDFVSAVILLGLSQISSAPINLAQSRWNTVGATSNSLHHSLPFIFVSSILFFSIHVILHFFVNKVGDCSLVFQVTPLLCSLTLHVLVKLRCSLEKMVLEFWLGLSNMDGWVWGWNKCFLKCLKRGRKVG